MSSTAQKSTSYRDEETLRRLYVEKGLTTYEIADELECSQYTIRTWMERHGIDRRRRGRHNRVEYATYEITTGNYELWKDQICEESIYVHQLLAIADGADPYDVFDDSMVCHHRSDHPRDNRPGNIEVMDWGEHSSHHCRQEIPECKRELLERERVIKYVSYPLSIDYTALIPHL
ncbi:hypothetical protein [Natrialba aegyptia]|uniref:HNH endonuclease n=1 Tax=Natrialba aegyptia DSM 13077 TaxID=1227491 RepID=M0B905_9EURY|nr:hypothetical protein [Natrialba aegyptia]ELZ06783.1 HNH endonuclease [Natrialba aegyptia DSM 13077]